jgi:uncharacterized protein (DUF1015 family)
MARIEPFKALRPPTDIAHLVASPPYDVLSSEEARNLAADNPLSFLHIVKPEIDLPPATDLYSEAVYNQARENMQRFQRENTLVQDPQKRFYLYKQIWGDHTQVGLVAGASVQDYQDDVIKKHEHTRPDKENDRMRHIEALNANTGPVFLTFKQTREIDLLFDRAMEAGSEYDFTSKDGVRHIFYVISDTDIIEKMRTAFRELDTLYVADGHHRSASATRVKIKRQQENPGHSGDEEYNFFLSVLFPHNQMKILPYNRVVKSPEGLCKAEFFHTISRHFSYEDTGEKSPARPHEFGLYIGGKWYMLRALPASFKEDDPVSSLDVSILQDHILAPILGITDPRKDKRIDFVGGIRGTEELERRVDSGEFDMAFSLYPTTIEQLFAVADSGRVMPPKSTWFEPKLRSGLAVHLLSD